MMAVERNMLDVMPIDMAETVIQYLNPVDIIEVANLSTQWSCAVNAFRIGIAEIYIDCSGMHRTDSMKFGCAQAIIGFKPVCKSFIHFFLYEKTQRELDELVKEPGFSEKEFNEETLLCRIDETNIKVFTRFPMQSYYAVLKHMLHLFSGDVDHINIAYNAPPADEMTFWVLDQAKVQQCKRLSFPFERTMSGALLNRALDLPNLYRLYSPCEVQSGFRRRKTTKISRLHVGFAGWVTLRFLLSLDCETIVIGETSLTVKEINTFIKTWLNGDNKKLRICQFVFCMPANWKRRGIKHLMDDIEYVQRDPKKKKRRYFKCYNQYVDMSDGKDFMRKDGARASINYMEHAINFVIWNYPE